MMRLVRTVAEVNELIELAHAGKDEGGKFPGMCYEEGILAVLEWVTGETDENPMKEED